jgi:hypothetical protein
MKRIVILTACNSATISAVADFPSVAGATAVNARVVEGRMTIPYGMWPVTIVNAEGKEEKVVQRLDKAVAGRLMAAFNSFRGRLSRIVSGSPIFMGHPDYAKATAANAWSRLGKNTGMEAGEDALVVIGDFTPEAKTILAANETLAPSPHWGLARTAEKKDDLAICEPVAFYSMGITPRPNIAGAAVNEAVPPPIDSAAVAAVMMDGSIVAQQLADCCAEMLQLKDALAAAVAAKDTADQQLAALAKIVAEKENALLQERTWGANLRAEMDALRAALQQEKADAIATSVNSILDGATAAGRIVAADREHWRDKIMKLPAAVNELFAPAALKVESVVDPARVAAANADLGTRPAADRFVDLVRQHMATTKTTWEIAWNECQAKHSELYKLMPNGGKA